jgi:nitroreductase
MDALQCIATRRSIRNFLPTLVDQETILTIVEAGSHAPSSGNVQDWRIIIVDDKELLKSLCVCSLNQECIHNAAFLIVVCSDPEMCVRHYGLRGEKLYSVQNCAAACQNMLLAAHALGLGGVWVGAFDETRVRSILKIPSNVRPQAILSFGYPAQAPPAKNHMDLALITFFNAYGNKVKHTHRLLRDYHVEWEKRIRGAHSAIERLKELTVKSAGSAPERVKGKASPLLAKYKKKFSDKFRLKRKSKEYFKARESLGKSK